MLKVGSRRSGTGGAMSQVALRTITERDRVPLRELTRRNVPHLYGMVPMGEPSCDSDSERDEWITAVLAAVASGSRWFGVIELAGDLVGALSLSFTRGHIRSATLGYWVDAEHSGQGVTTEAVRQALDLAFGSLGMHRVEAYVRPDNPGSLRVLERNGFQRVGVARGQMHLAGRWWDMVYLDCLAPWDDGVRLVGP
ncbi:N-acetyltransferase [Pseudonocardiaceae bacterium YIM PH 21723]|nr:N-acetyltransferase [Pseudonocardiaceae bacterium YIM PH 21723]